MKRILEVNVDDVNTGGVYSFVKSIVAQNTEFKIDIACLEEFRDRKHVEDFALNHVDIYFVGYNGLRLVKQFVIYYKLKKLIIDGKYDCVHIHSDVANKMLVTGLAAKRANCKKIIFHSHSSGVEGNFKWIRILLHKFCSAILQHLGTNFIACSENAATWMFKNINNLMIIHNGIDIKRYRYDISERAKQRNKLGLTDETVVLGHVGRFTEVKNHKFLIDILQYLLSCDDKYILLFVGEGPLETTIKDYVRNKKLESKVVFYGTTDEVENTYQIMDVFLLPSIFEGYPIVSVEAQASGLTCIISNTIVKSVKILGSTDFLPIGFENVKLWGDRISECKKTQREDCSLIIKEAGFDLVDTAQKLFSLYSSD